MRKIIYDPQKRTLALIIIYIFLMALSLCAIIIYPLSRQKGFFIKHAHEVADKYTEGSGELSLWMDGRQRVSVFDIGGNLVYDAASDKAFMGSFDNSKYLPEIFSGNESFHVEAKGFLAAEGFYGIAGVPVIKDGEITGAAFFIRKIIAIIESAVSFAIVFTILYVLSAYFIISSILKQKELEEERQIYVDNFTHALKTPVASVKVLAEALCDGVITDPLKQQMYYGLILSETTKQSKMIQQILELSKLQSGQTDMNRSKVAADELFGQILEKNIKLADLLEINIHVDNEICHLPALMTNKNGISEIMQILLDNAFKYLTDGCNLWIEAERADRNVVICVKDDGNGISAEDLPHIFERFYRGKNSASSESSGLGLAIAKEIADRLGERIWVESTEGQGSAFYFTIAYAK